MSALSPEEQHRIAVAEVPPEKLEPDPDPEPSQRRDDFTRYIAPCGVVLCLVAGAVISPWLALLAVVCMLAIVPSILLHEFAHMITGLATRMKVLEFSLGFGPRLWSRTWRGIIWSIRAVPLGGSVELAGMTVEAVEKEDDVSPSDAFVYQPPMARLAVVLAGVLMNLFLAWAALTATILLMIPQDMWSWGVLLKAPQQSLGMIWTLLGAGTSALIGAAVDWNSSDTGSILSLPQQFAMGAQESMSAGIPLGAYLMLFVAALNLSLALFNVLPLYPLDGYHAVTALTDQTRMLWTRFRDKPFAPLTTWRLRWFARSTGAMLAVFVGSILVRDIIRLM